MSDDDIAGADSTGTGKMALFITGASGFLGSKILEQIEPDSFSEITLLSRKSLELPAQYAASDNINVIQAAIHDTEQYASRLDSNTIVLHLAAITGKAEPRDYYYVNTDGTAVLLKMAKSAGVMGFLFVSSIAVSFSDRKGYHYAESKQQAELHVRKSGLKYTIVRPTIILGRGSSIWDRFSGLSRSFLILLPGSGKARIQPVYIGDLVMLLLGIISSGRFMGEVLEVGGPEVLTMDDLVRRIHRAYRGDQGRILHLPLSMILGILRTLEQWVPASLPVSSGQFASFFNDGTAEENDLHQSLGIKMKTVDDMLDSLTRQERMRDREQISVECGVFTRYLTGQMPDSCIVEKYAAAFLPGKPLNGNMQSCFDALLVRFAIIHPLFTRTADAFSRFFYTGSTLSKRLIILLAILESRASTVVVLDNPDKTTYAGFLFSMVMQFIVFAILLGIAMIFLLPLKLLLGRKPVKNRDIV